MNADFIYPLILCFASGFTQCLLIVASIFLFRNHNKTQYQRSFAVVLIMLAIGFLNNLIMEVCSKVDYVEYLNTLLLLYDYIIVGGFMIFCVTLVFPDRYKPSQLFLIEVPYIIALVLYAVTHSHMVYNGVQIYTISISTVLLIWLNISIKKYDRMLLNDVGDIENYNLRWVSFLLVVLYIAQLIWAIESLSQERWFYNNVINKNLIFDTLWCFITIAYILLIFKKIIQQKVFVIPEQENTSNDNQDNNTQDSYYKVLYNSDIDAIIQEKKYYLDPSMTLQKLSTLLGTNRQYLSNFINREKQRTFYEYINDFRLKEAKNLLDNWNNKNGQSIEDIATMSGFNSYSTFLRSFVKKYGISPSKYLKQKAK